MDASVATANIEANCIPEPNTGCWLWLRCVLTRSGYGMCTRDGKRELAHRVAWTDANGPIPAGLVIDHMCRVRSCVNPSHLRAVSNRTNILAGVGAGARNAAKTKCPAGHPYDFLSSNGYRMCRACRRAERLRNGPGRRLLARTRRSEDSAAPLRAVGQ